MRRLFVLLAACLAASALAAGPAAAGDDDKPKRPKDPKKAKAQIEEAYTCFLSAALNYTIEQKLACVAGSDDPEFIATATELQQANAAAAGLTEAEITKIKFRSKKSAEVTFDIIIGGEPALPDQGGGAVFVRDEEQDKRVWKVSPLTLCNLFSLANPALTTEGPCADIIANDRI
jgi:hypothetical protein